MEKTLKEKTNEKLRVISEIVTKLEYDSKIIEENEIEIPTILIATEKDYKGENIIVSCNLMPMNLGGIDVLFLQYYLCLAEGIPQEKEQLIQEFIKKQNENFMIGNVLEFMDSVCMKYSLYLDPDEELDQVFFARTLDIFTFQADVLSRKIDQIINEKITVDDAVAMGSFFD